MARKQVAPTSVAPKTPTAKHVTGVATTPAPGAVQSGKGTVATDHTRMIPDHGSMGAASAAAARTATVKRPPTRTDVERTKGPNQAR